MLLNKQRAYEVMDKHKIDGLLAAQRQNVYYLTDFFSYTLAVERHLNTFAVLPRRADMPAGMSVSLTENGRLGEMGSWVPNVYAITGRVSPTAANVGKAASETDTRADPAAKYKLNPNATLTPIEERWSAFARARTGKLAATASDALKQMVVDAGLSKARIATDDPRLIPWLHEMGLTGVTGVDASNIFREIRMVKSKDEIDLLRTASQNNEAAVEAVIKMLHLGATLPEINRTFMVEHARRDGQGIYILIGMIPGMRSGKVVQGEPFMIDALGTFARYNGDLGRTVVFGAPDAETKKRDRALQIGWQTACETMKPGIKGSEIVRKVMDVMHKEGFPTFNHCVAHTIGVEHTDHPIPIGPSGLGGVPDFTVEENMVLNFDMPYQEWGWGSMHIEDTMLITRNGYEPLTSFKTQLRVL